MAGAVLQRVSFFLGALWEIDWDEDCVSVCVCGCESWKENSLKEREVGSDDI